MGLGGLKHGPIASVTLKTVPGRYYRMEISADLQNWTQAGIFRAAGWPATVTQVTIPATALPVGWEAAFFARFAPASAPP
jgi:hypothetical protein